MIVHTLFCNPAAKVFGQSHDIRYGTKRFGRDYKSHPALASTGRKDAERLGLHSHAERLCH